MLERSPSFDRRSFDNFCLNAVLLEGQKTEVSV